MMKLEATPVEARGRIVNGNPADPGQFPWQVLAIYVLF